MRKTLRLKSDAGYRFRNGVVEYLFDVPGPVDDEGFPVHSLDSCEWQPTKYRVGAQAILVSSTNVSPNALRDGRSKPHYRLHWDLAGVPGNSDPKIKRSMGWRGTTGDLSCDAYGVVTIRTIRTLKNGDIAVTVA